MKKLLLLPIMLLILLSSVLALTEWEENTYYEVGDIVSYNGLEYEVLQSHTSLSVWTPDIVPALFKIIQSECLNNEWCEDTYYEVGDLVSYNNVHYEVLQSHTSLSVWTPDIVPALFNPLLQINNGKTIIQKNNVSITYNEELGVTPEQIQEAVNITIDKKVIISVDSNNYNELNTTATIIVKNYEKNFFTKLYKLETTTNGTTKRVKQDIEIKNNNEGVEFTVPSFSTFELVDNTAAYYTFDEDSGTIAGDSTPNENDATIDGATWTTGVINSGLNFDGTNDKVSLPLALHDTYLKGSEKVLVSMWIEKSSTANGMLFYGRNTAGTAAYDLFITSGRLRIGGRSQNADAFQQHTGTTTISASTRYHIVGVYDYEGSRLTTYINDVKDVDEAVSFGSSTSNFDAAFLDLGALDSSNWYAGMMDEVAFFDATGWSTAEVEDVVAYLYASGSPGADQQYPFGQNLVVNITSAYLSPNTSVYTTETDLRGYVVVNDTTSVNINYTYYVNDESVVSGTFSGSPSGNTFTLPVLSNSEFQQFDNITFTSQAVNSSNTSQAISQPFTSEGVIIQNRPPVIEQLSLTKSPLLENNKHLKGFVTITDLDEDTITYSYTLTRDREGNITTIIEEEDTQYTQSNQTLFTILESETEITDVYTLTLIASDGIDTEEQTILTTIITETTTGGGGGVVVQEPIFVGEGLFRTRITNDTMIALILLTIVCTIAGFYKKRLGAISLIASFFLIPLGIILYLVTSNLIIGLFVMIIGILLIFQE